MEARIMVEDFLNFTLDVDEEDYRYDENTLKAPSSSITTSNSQDPDDSTNPEHAEEELEWLSNKDAFPSVETCFDILTPNPSIAHNQRSPVYVLDLTSSIFLAPARYPMKPRSKRRRPRQPIALADLANQQYWCHSQVDKKNSKKQQLQVTASPSPKAPAIGRRCQHCGAEETPQWRAGPMGPKTLCNACGVRYKLGRLVPEYRPVSSPTFSSSLHSNSHRKVMEMRRQKQMG